MKAELRRRMHNNIYEIAILLGWVMCGWLRYFAVPTNFRSLSRFVHLLKRLRPRVLRRPSQKDRFTWDKVDLLAGVFWPRHRILHTWPNRRFNVNHSR